MIDHAEDHAEVGMPRSDTRAMAEDHPCSLLRYHAPHPVITEYHHSKPVFLQDRLYGEIRYGPDTWVCGNCHDAIHAWLYYLLGMHRRPPSIGTHAKAAAEATFAWYEGERERLGK